MDDYDYDLFISYSTADRAWVRDVLLARLEGAGLTVCIDYRDFRPGSSILGEIERAIESSRKTLLVFTPVYLESEWTKLENLMLQTESPANDQRRFLVVLKQPCELPRRLRTFIYVNFTHPAGEDLEREWLRLFTFLNWKPSDMPMALESLPVLHTSRFFLWGLPVTVLFITSVIPFLVGLLPQWLILVMALLWSLVLAGHIFRYSQDLEQREGAYRNALEQKERWYRQRLEQKERWYRQRLAQRETRLQTLEQEYQTRLEQQESQLQKLVQEHQTQLREQTQEHQARFLDLLKMCEGELQTLWGKLSRLGSTMVWIDASVRLTASNTLKLATQDVKNIITVLLQDMLMLLATDVRVESKAASFLVLHEDGRRFELFAEVGHRNAAGSYRHLEAEVARRIRLDNSLAGYVLKTDEVVVIADLDNIPKGLPWVELSGDKQFPARALAPADLAGVESPIGVLCLDIAQPYALSDQDQQLLLIIASKVAYLWSLCDIIS